MLDIIKNIPCCNCQQSMANNKYLNAIPTTILCDWAGPKMGNFNYPEYGETAMAYVCDSCQENKPGEFQFVVGENETLLRAKDLPVIKIWGAHPHDRRFEDSPDAGHPACKCSRCLKLIGANDAPIRAWPKQGATTLEYRYHPECLGATTFKDDDY